MKFTTKDPRGYIISCSTNTWNNHIITGHPIMNTNEEAVISTIECPDIIYKSKEYDNRDIYYSLGTMQSYPNLYTKVVVQLDENVKEGKIMTAWGTRKISGIDEGRLLYVKNKL